MPITFDAGSAGQDSFTHIPAGSPNYAVVVLNASSIAGTPAISSVTYGVAALSKLFEMTGMDGAFPDPNFYTAQIWGGHIALAGVQSVQITGNQTKIEAGCATFLNVNSSGGAAGVNNAGNWYVQAGDYPPFFTQTIDVSVTKALSGNTLAVCIGALDSGVPSSVFATPDTMLGYFDTGVMEPFLGTNYFVYFAQQAESGSGTMSFGVLTNSGILVGIGLGVELKAIAAVNKKIYFAKNHP